MHATTALPAELNIYHVAELRQQWLELIAKGSKASRKRSYAFDGSAVDQLDAAGVQLLVALSHSLALQQGALQIVDASGPLRQAFEALGIGHLLTATGPAQGAHA